MSQFKVDRVREAARGRWREVLLAAGVGPEALSGKPGPCPFCRTGVDRWVFDDKRGYGTGFCRQCDATGDGFQLAAKALGVDIRGDFPRVLSFVADQIGLAPDSTQQLQRNAELVPHAARRIWDEAEPLNETNDSLIRAYFMIRGISKIPGGAVLRFHKGLAVYRDSLQIGTYPAMVAAVTDSRGALIAIHRTYLSTDGFKAPIGRDAKKSMGTVSGGCIKLYSECSEVIGVSEGIETALSISTAIGLPMIAAPSGPVMHAVPIPSSVRQVHIWADLDRNGAGKGFAEKLARRLHESGKEVVLHFPSESIPTDAKSIDWNDVLLRHGLEPIQASFMEARPWTPNESLSWPERERLPSTLAPVPKLDLAMMPESLREWISDHADRMQLPPEFIAGCSIVMLGSAIGRRCGVYPMQLNDWLVIPCLWGGLVAPPSVLKTPAMTAAIGPLRRMESKSRKEYKDEKEKYDQNVEDQNFTLDRLRRKLKANAKVDSDSDEHRKDQADYRKLKQELDASHPKLKRYSTSDSTTEKLGEILQDNPEGVLVFRDELYGFLKGLEKQGRENDRAFYLEAWNGLGSYTFDRIERGTIHVAALCVSIFGGIQPDRLKAYFEQILESGSGDDGFLSRFQILLYPDPPAGYKYTDRAPNRAARARVEAVVERIVTTDFRKGLEVDQAHDVPAFRFSPGAQETFRIWYENLNRRLLDATEEPVFVSHLGKYRSLLPALALIFHIVENCEAKFGQQGISQESVLKAKYWVDFLEQHARRVYGQVTEPDVHAAHALAKKIEQGKLISGSTVRDIYRNEWAGLKSPELVRSGLALLARCGWLKVIDSGSDGPGPKSEIIELHPDFKKGGRQ